MQNYFIPSTATILKNWISEAALSLKKHLNLGIPFSTFFCFIPTKNVPGNVYSVMSTASRDADM